jgi:hypothetical protein
MDVQGQPPLANAADPLGGTEEQAFLSYNF